MYITATTQNLSKKCYMQYLFPLINYTSYKNKTSIFHLSSSLPTEGTLNPSSDPLSLAHPSPEVAQWLGWRESTWSTAFPGAAGLSSETTSPEEPSLPSTQGTVGKGWSEGTRVTGLAGKAGRGRMVSAGPGQWPLLGTAGLSVAANSSWAQVGAAAGPTWPPQHPGCWARVQEALGLEQLWQREYRYTPLCLAMLGLGAQTGPPEHARSLT